MKISLNWLREYVDLPADLDLETLAHDLTMRTVEVEHSLDLGQRYEGIVVGRVENLGAHPNADRLRLAAVDIGSGQPLTLVCGGSNLAIGQTVVVALPGASVVWHGEGEPVVLKATKVRGVLSAGMICAAAEVGLEALFPSREEGEIIDLSASDAQPGEALAAVLDLNDQILEIDNKSLTNRPDLWCHYGMARELAAIYGLDLKPLPAPPDLSGLAPYPIVIEDGRRCRRYVGLEIEGVTIEPSPLWLQSALFRVGMRPINRMVDLTNYVMLAVGQPTHAFDRDHVKEEIRVRDARAGEQLELLDGSLLDLRPSDLVIADAQDPIGLAGIMGGRQDSILPDTEKVILEIANFQATVIRRTAQHFALRTESSIRFDKALDTQRVDAALGLSLALLKELLPDTRLVAWSDVEKEATEPPVIEVALSYLASRLGFPVQAADVQKYLHPLGFEVTAADSNLLVRVPSWRATGDCSLPADVLEEVARMIGYEHFAFKAPAVTLERAVLQPDKDLDRRLRESLALRAGFREIFTYPWIDDSFIDAAGLKQAHLELAAPPSARLRRLRASLIPGLLEAIEKNRRYYDRFRLFELTQVFQPGAVSPSVPEEVLPRQERRLAGALVDPGDAAELFFQAKGVLQDLGHLNHMEELVFVQERQPAWADRAAWLNVTCNGESVGDVGLVSLPVLAAAGIRNTKAVLFELNVERLVPFAARTNSYRPLPHYPLVELDITALVDEERSWQEVHDLIAPEVSRIHYVGEYRGPQVGDNRRALTLRVHFGSDQGTLTGEEIQAKKDRIIAKLRRELAAEVRES